MGDEIQRDLSDPLRRRVLHTVAERDESIELDTLGAETIMEAEEWNAHQIALYHTHLPRLDDHGLIQWDREERIIEEGDRFEEVRPLLDSLDSFGFDSNDDRFSPSFGIMLASALV